MSQPTMSFALKLIGFFVATLFSSVAGGQNVVINGDFETGPFETNGVVTGWTVTGDVGNTDSVGSTTASHAAAFSLGDDSEGNMLSQTLATTSGINYTLEFDAGVFGVRTAGPLTLQVQVFGAGMGTLLEETVTPPYNGNFNPTTFNHYTFTFTADSSSTILKFTDSGLGNANADIALDTVSVVPEPVSSILVTLGALPLLYAVCKGRRRTR